MKTIVAILFLLALALPSSAQKISAMPETFTINQSDLIMVTVPGVNNYKSTFITFATNLNPLLTISASTTNAVLSGSNLAVTNATTFGVFYDVSSLTNMRFFSLKQGTNMVIYRDGSNIVLNATGTGGGGGAGDVTTAQLNTASNAVLSLALSSDTVTSNATIRNLNGLGTNLTVYLGLGLPTLTASRPAFINASGNLTNVSGTPDGTKFVRDDGVLATPAGSGDVTTAQLNTASNAVVTILVANDTTTSNGLYAVETTRNAAVSNAVVTLLVANDTTTSNALRSVSVSGLTNKMENSNGTGTNTDIHIALEVFGDLFVSTNLYVTNAVFGQSLSVVDFYANNFTLTNAIGSNVVRIALKDLTNYSQNPFVIAGVGGANTNFTLQAKQPEAIINGFTNVSIRGVMSYDAAMVDRWRVVITNGSGADRTLEFSAVTNNWKFDGIYGHVAPSVLTNATQLEVQARQVGTNVLVAYRYYPWP